MSVKEWAILFVGFLITIIVAVSIANWVTPMSGSATDAADYNYNCGVKPPAVPTDAQCDAFRNDYRNK